MLILGYDRSAGLALSSMILPALLAMPAIFQKAPPIDVNEEKKA